MEPLAQLVTLDIFWTVVTHAQHALLTVEHVPVQLYAQAVIMDTGWKTKPAVNVQQAASGVTVQEIAYLDSVPKDMLSHLGSVSDVHLPIVLNV